MYFKLSNGHAKKWLLLSCLFASFQPSLAAELTKKDQGEQADKVNKLSLSRVSFSAQPANCIALRHGRTCYANVKLTWSRDIKENYCLYIKQPEVAQEKRQRIQCWENSMGNQIIFNFESNKKIEFQLMSSKDNNVIAEAAVEVSWVHKATPRKRRWRIF